ncbi:hypothetical protein F443_02828 [Phytophthora nicotianae P1569]|uniref:Uncharacterized protein n=1 Tax=Phytophthora nicotianae P1569 TaxID=1317065 RepID=V9FS94_PHYNI|nr:hypothetical protein F443_02828 [Phytophthora nicotianae P1569]
MESLRDFLAESINATHRLNDALGFDQVLAALQPLPDILPNLPRAAESLETLINLSTAEINEVCREVKHLKQTIIDAMDKQIERDERQRIHERLAGQIIEERKRLLKKHQDFLAGRRQEGANFGDDTAPLRPPSSRAPMTKDLAYLRAQKWGCRSSAATLLRRRWPDWRRAL